MLRAALLGFVLAASSCASVVRADGKIYASDLVELPDQRAIVVHDGKEQILLLQSRFAAPEGRRVAAVGWVVPMPAIPQVGYAPAGWADSEFRRLGRDTSASELTLLPFVTALAVGTLIYYLVAGALASFSSGRTQAWARAHSDNPRSRTLRTAAMLGFIGCLLVAVSLPSYQGVEVVRQVQAGPYAANVVRATSSHELVEWLKQNGFAFGPIDAAAFDGYIGKRWVFVTARISTEQKDADFGRGGMSPPLLLRFASPQIIYPLALTATVGRPIELTLYVYAPSQVDAGTRLALRYSDRGASPALFAGVATAPEGFLKGFAAAQAAHLTKLTGRLEPAQMREDLILFPAQTPQRFRESTLSPTFKVYGGASLAVAALAALALLTRRPCFRRLHPAYYLLVSLFLTPLAGLLFLLVHAVTDFRAWRRERAASS